MGLWMAVVYPETKSVVPFVALSLILASAMGAPSGIIAPAGVVATHGVVANTVGAAVTQSHGPAPLATHPLKAGPVVPHPVNYMAPPAPAPYTTCSGTWSHHHPPTGSRGHQASALWHH